MTMYHWPYPISLRPGHLPVVITMVTDCSVVDTEFVTLFFDDFRNKIFWSVIHYPWIHVISGYDNCQNDIQGVNYVPGRSNISTTSNIKKKR